MILNYALLAIPSALALALEKTHESPNIQKRGITCSRPNQTECLAPTRTETNEAIPTSSIPAIPIPEVGFTFNVNCENISPENCTLAE